jgi:predicted O-methyltransferase YrrM
MHHPHAQARFDAAVSRAPRATNSKRGKLVLEAVRSAAANEWARDQLEAFAKIEARRDELYADIRPIPVVDYGSPDHAVRQVPLAKIARNSKAPVWAKLVHQIVRTTGTKSCLEMGSCVGISAAHIAAAGVNSLVTLEGAPAIADVARETLRVLGYSANVVTGRFADTLEAALSARPLDCVFVDGHHVGPATIGYWQQIKPHLTDRAVVIFDDIHWTPDMAEAWEKIRSGPDVEWSLDLETLGVVIPKRS